MSTENNRSRNDLENDWRGTIFALQQQVFQFFILHEILLRKEMDLRKEAEVRKKRAKKYLRRILTLASQSLIKNDSTLNLRTWKITESTNFWEVEVQQFSEIKFKDSFRMTRKSFETVVKKLAHLEKKTTHIRAPIPLTKRIAIAIYALGSLSEYQRIADLFGVGRTTVGQFMRVLCKAVWTMIKSDYIKSYPPVKKKIRDTVSAFEKKGIPQCYGVVKSLHMPIRLPKEKSKDYRNNAGYDSIIFQAAVDHKGRFTDVSTIGLGGTNPNRLFDHSVLKQQHQLNPIFKELNKTINGVSIPVMLIGDAKLQLSEVILKAYPDTGNLTPAQLEFNKRVAECERIAEVAFDHLVARFRRFLKVLDLNIENVPIVIKACAVLHNLCIEERDNVLAGWIDEKRKVTVGRKPQPQEIFTGADTEAGIKIRNALTEYIATQKKPLFSAQNETSPMELCVN